MELLSVSLHHWKSLTANVFGHLSCVHHLWKALALLGSQRGRSSVGATEMYFAHVCLNNPTRTNPSTKAQLWGKWSAAMFLSGLQRKPKVVLVTHVMELTHNGRIFVTPDTPYSITLTLPVRGNAPLQSHTTPFFPAPKPRWCRWFCPVSLLTTGQTHRSSCTHTCRMTATAAGIPTYRVR